MKVLYIFMKILMLDGFDIASCLRQLFKMSETDRTYMSSAECLATEVWVYMHLLSASLRKLAANQISSKDTGVEEELPASLVVLQWLQSSTAALMQITNYNVQFGFFPWTLAI